MAEEEKPVAKTQQQRNAERFRKLEDGFKEKSSRVLELAMRKYKVKMMVMFISSTTL